jgi:hypothetical protein
MGLHIDHVIPDFAEPVIGRAFARPVGSIRATMSRSDAKVVDGFRLICRAVQPFQQKYFCFPARQISGVMCAFRTHKRGARDRHERWVWNAMDAMRY